MSAPSRSNLPPAPAPPDSVPLIAIAALFVVSGAAGLIYEVIWIRSLTLVFGKTVYAAGAVLAAFMAGLALGSAWGGRLVDRMAARGRHPLRVYGLLEAGIGLWALVLPLVIAGIGYAYVALSGPFERLSAGLTAMRFILATLALMPATSLMGATLPALSRWAVRHDSQVGRRLGLLYALNTLGGVLGCLAAGFLLLEALGLALTTLVAASGNVAVAAIALALSRRAPAPAATAEAASPASASPASSRAPHLTLVMAAVALGGFGALVLEVTWTRTLLLVFGSTTYSFSAMLSVFLFGIGAGSLIMTPIADRLKRPWLTLGLLQGGIGILVLVCAHLMDRLPGLYLDLLARYGLTWGNELAMKFLLSAALMLLPTMLSGAVWPVAVRLARPSRSTLGAETGRLYAANTIGSILGSLAGAFVLLPWLGMEYTMAAISIVFAGFGAALALMDQAPLPGRAAAALLIVMVAGALGVTLRPWDRKVLTSGAYFMPRAYLDEAGRPVLEERLKETHLLFYEEGVTTTPSVAILGDINKAFFNDGKIEGATALDGLRLQRMLGHYPFLMVPGEPKIGLIIGMGSGITVGAMGVHPVPRIDCAELEPAVVDAAGQFDAESFSVLSRPGLRIIYNDGRNHLMLTKEPYDVISSEPFAPLVDGAVSVYTLEHFRLVRSRLAPGGMTAQWLPLYQLAPADYLSIMKTFAQVFPDATVWITGSDTILLGSAVPAGTPQTIDFARLVARMQDPKVARSLQELGLDEPMRLLATYCFRVSDVERDLEEIAVITDDHARIEFSAPRAHLVNTVKDNLPWLLARMRSPAPFIRFPDDWAADDPRHGQMVDRLTTLLKVQQLTMQGRLQVLNGELETGIATLEQAAQDNLSDIYARDLAARNLVKLAGRLYAQHRHADATAAYERALHWDPKHFLALYNLALLVYEKGDTARARQLTEQALAQAPFSPSLNYRMGLLLYESGDNGGAERSLKAALDVEPRYADPLMVLGDIYQARADHARASLMYRQAIAFGKDDAEASAALAQSLLDEGRREEAARLVAHALTLSPGYAEAVLTRARLSLAAGRRDEAMQDLRAALQTGGERLRRRALADPELRPLVN